MKHPNSPHEDPWENDDVWNLLEHSTTTTPSPRFADDTVRSAQLSAPPHPWSKPAWAIASFSTGLLGAAATLIVAIILHTSENLPPTTTQSNNAAQIEEIVETEILIAAIDHMENFSDTELVSLIGF